MYRRATPPDPEPDPTLRLAWKRELGTALVLVGIIGVVAFPFLSDQDLDLDVEAPYWVRLAIASLVCVPLVLGGLAHLLNETRFTIRDRSLHVQARPLPFPRDRSLALEDIRRFELHSPEDADRTDLVAVPKHTADRWVLFKAVGDGGRHAVDWLNDQLGA